MYLFYFLFWITVSVYAKEPLYGKIGDKVVLTPDSVVNPFTSIVWKHGPRIAIEWFQSGVETFLRSHQHFKVRGRLNTLTGSLTIKGLTPDDSGSYTVEINNKVTSKTELLVISPVSKPTVSISCEMTYCVLTCDGDTTGTEPVTYRWTSGDTTWSSTKEHKITMVEKELWFSWFSCAFENPVSSNSSEKVFNPFIRARIWMIILTAVLLLLVACIIIVIICFIYKCRKGESADGTGEEMTEMLPPVQETSTQGPTPVVTQNTSNGTERPASPGFVEETSNQDTTSTGPPETSKETDMSPMIPDNAETHC